jgi:two-component system nitrogen regulation response regulator NtrX
MAEPVVLVVDDEEGIRESLSGIFEDEGYIIVTATSGEEALDLLKEHNPDLVLLDIWLPGIDGIKTLEKIRALKHDFRSRQYRTRGEDNEVRCLRLP